MDAGFLDALGDDFDDAPVPVAPAPAKKAPPRVPPPPKRERDEVLSRSFFDEASPTMQLERGTKDEGSLLFQTAAAGRSRRSALNLPSGRFAGVGTPDVLADFAEAPSEGPADDEEDDGLISVGPFDALGADLIEASEAAQGDGASGPDADVQDNAESEGGAKPADEEAPDGEEESDDKGVAAVPTVAAAAAAAAGASTPKSGPPSKPAKASSSGSAASSAVAAAAAVPPSEDGLDGKKLGIAAVAALLLLIVGISMMGGDDETPEATPSPTVTAKASDNAKPAGPDANSAALDGGAADAGGAGASAGAGGVGAGAEEGTPGAEGSPDGGAAPAEAAASEGDGQGEGDDVVVVEEDDTGASADAGSGGPSDDDGGSRGAAGHAGKSHSGASKTNKPADRQAEDDMSAADLRKAARTAIKEKRYGDAYRLAGKAQRKQPGEAASALRVEAACGMNNKANAKQAFDSVKTVKTKLDLRSRCRDLGTRLGL